MRSICSANTLNFGQLWPRLLTSVIVVAIHAWLLLVLQAQVTAPADAVAPAPLVIDLIEPAPTESRPRPRTSPKPVLQRVAKPRSSPPQPPARAVAAPDVAANQQEPAPSRAAPLPEPAIAAAAETQPAASAEPEPVATTAPRFDAAYLNNPAPEYPRQSRRAGEAGKVVLRVLVTPEGSAGEMRLRDSSGFELLDQAAIAAVRQWRFVAARRGETNVAAWVVVPLRFDLDR